jgi:hypothetical protein
MCFVAFGFTWKLRPATSRSKLSGMCVPARNLAAFDTFHHSSTLLVARAPFPSFPSLSAPFAPKMIEAMSKIPRPIASSHQRTNCIRGQEQSKVREKYELLPQARGRRT